MSTDRDVTRIVRSWLHEAAHEDADRILNLVLDEIDTTPQRQAGWLARRFPVMNSNTVRFGLLAVAIVVIALLGSQLLPGSNFGGPPQPTPTPTVEPAPTASPSPPVDFTGHPGEGAELDPGDYVITYASPVQVTITVPDEPFGTYSSAWYKAQFDWGPWHQSNQAQLGFAFVENIFEDPCVPELGVLEPALGPTVADLTTALAALPGVEVTGPSDIAMGGYSGQLVELSGIERSADCVEEAPMWVMTGGDSWLLPDVGGRTRVWILDVAGVRLVVWASESAGFTDRAALQSLVDSIQIE
jgi:hypothetical protein